MEGGRYDLYVAFIRANGHHRELLTRIREEPIPWLRDSAIEPVEPVDAMEVDQG